MAHFIRIYTPFIITIFTLINSLLFLTDVDTAKFAYILSIISGNSVLLTTYIYYVSRRMCIWYKLNLFCLLLTQLLSLAYNCLEINFSLYIWTVVLFCSFGIACLLIFKKYYNVEIKRQL